jgi:hypothetical protein
MQPCGNRAGRWLLLMDRQECDRALECEAARIGRQQELILVECRMIVVREEQSTDFDTLSA